jgi:surface antigen
MKKYLVIGATALSLSACTTDGMPVKQTVGALGGGAAGAYAGSQFGSGTGRLIATGAGTLLGAFLGSSLGASLDRADQIAANQAAQQAYTAPMGQTVSWSSPETGNSGTITPIREGKTSSGAYCREFQQTIIVNGRSEAATGQACQQSNGTWQIVS